MWRPPTIDQIAISDAIHGPHTETWVSGPYGSGKTGFATPRLLEWAHLTHSEAQGAIITRSIDSFHAMVMGEIEPWCAHHGVPLVKQDTGYWIGPNYYWRVIGNDKRSHERLKGRNLAVVLADEVVDLPPTLVDQALSRLRVSPMKFVGLTNPDGPAHMIRTDHIDPIIGGRRPGDYIELPLWANPTLPLEYVEQQIHRFTGMYLQRYVYGRWVAASGAVYPFLHDAVRPAPKSEKPVRLGLAVDPGSSVPTHALAMGHYSNGRCWVVAEWRHDPVEGGGPMRSDRQASEIADWFCAQMERFEIDRPGTSVVDHADPPAMEALQREFRKRGHYLVLAEYEKGEINAGIRSVDRRLNNRILLIDPRCKHLIQEMAGLTWDTSPLLERHVERPDPTKPDHGADAVRYYVIAVLDASVL